jgi:hypothetical protein
MRHPQFHAPRGENGLTKQPMPRTLTIEEIGDFFRKKTIPCIRLRGKWLQAAGFHPNQSVQVTTISPGVIELRVNSPVQLDAETFRVMGVLDRVIAKYEKAA